MGATDTTAVHDNRRSGTRLTPGSDTSGVEATERREAGEVAEVASLAELELLAPSMVEGESEVVPFDEPVRWGETELHQVTWHRGRDAEDADGAAGQVSGSIGLPFLSGQVSADLEACGAPTGRYDLAATVQLAGHPVATVSSQGELIDGRIAAPGVVFDGRNLTVRLAPASLGEILPTEGAAPAASTTDDGAVSIDIAAVTDLPNELGALFRGESFNPAGREAAIPTPIAHAVEAVSGQVISGLRVIVDALFSPGGEPVGEASIEGTTMVFGPGRFAPDSAPGFARIARVIAAALAGQQGPVGDVAPDPTDTQAAKATGGGPAPAPDGNPSPEAAGTAAGDAAADALAEPETAPAADPAVDTDAESGEAPGDLETGGEEAPPADYELVIPPAPSAPTPAHRSAIARTGNRAGDAGNQADDVPAASESTADGRAAAEIPASESLGRAQQAVATALDQQIEPSPEIIELCEGIRSAIREHRPVDEDELLDADLREPADQASNSLNDSVTAEGDAVGENYQSVDEPPETEEPRPPIEPVAPDPSIGSPNLAAPGAAPPEIPAEDRSLEGDQAQVAQRVEASGIHTPVTAEIPDGTFEQVRSGEQELGDLATTGPAEVDAQQQAAIATSQEEMAALQQQALAAFNTARATNVGDTATRQTAMAETEQQTRDRLSGEASGVFEGARQQVTTLLSPLTQTAMSMWRSEVATLTTDFRSELDEVKRWVDERHAGVGGAVVAVWDSVAGLPSWVTRAYDRAERDFADGVCDALTRISVHVNTVIATVEGIITSAEEQIRRIYTENLPEGLEDWAAGELAGFDNQIASLRSDVEATRTGFLRDVSREAISAVQTVQAEVEALREEAKGVIDKVVDALAEFIEDPVTAIINGLLRLVGIPPASFWALIDKIQQVIADIADDPINFINNLVNAVRAGFEGFFERFPTHVISGFWDWLFSGIEGGIEMPADFSVGSLVSFALDLMGLSWEAIREILARHIGEENVELIEQAWELLSLLIEKGIDGVLEMIQDFLDPATILSTIIEAAVDYLVTTLIAVVIEKVVSMLNPVGIIAQAVMLIWDVLSWIFNNAARIFRFVETIVNGIADIVAGNISAMATAVEEALASLIPVVIDFLAQLMRLGGLPDAVADVIRGLRELVLAAVDRAIGFLVTQAQRLLEALGLGGDGDTPDGEDDAAADDEAGDTELGTEIRFSAEGESHRHWIDNDGNEAVLMVASVPMTVTDKLAEWNGKLADLDEDKQAQAQPLLARAGQLHAGADDAADQLAAVYAAAAAGQNDTDGDGDNDAPPSDAAVETAQRQLADTLDGLFTIFDGDPDLAGRFADELGRMHDKAKEDAEADIAEIRPGEAAMITTWDELKTQLARGRRIGAALARPTHAGPSAFARAAHTLTVPTLVSVAPERRETVLRARKQHLVDGADEPYGAMVAALHGLLWDKGSDPVRALTDGFETVLNGEVDPRLRLAVGGGLIDFLDRLSKGATVQEISKQNFEQEVWNRPKNRDFIKAEFRKLNPGSHEWIPTNMIPDVLAATNTPADALELDDWIQMHHEMRTDTDWIIFKPLYAQGTAEVGGESQSSLSGHVGAVYQSRDGTPTGQRRPLTARQGEWHDRLRRDFRPDSPPQVVERMRSTASLTVWGGGAGASALEYAGPYFQARSTAVYDLSGLASVAFDNRAGLLEQFAQWATDFAR